MNTEEIEEWRELMPWDIRSMLQCELKTARFMDMNKVGGGGWGIDHHKYFWDYLTDVMVLASQTLEEPS